MEQNEQQASLASYLQVLNRRKTVLIIAAIMITTMGIAASYVMPTEYEATSTVMIQSNIISGLVRDITSTPSTQERVRALQVVLMSRGHLMKVLTDMDLAIDRMPEGKIEGLIQTLQRVTRLRLEASGASSGRNDMDLFVVSFRNKDPRFARDYVNALIRRYIEDNLSSTRDAAMGANKFILEQLDMYKRKIDQANEELQSRKGENTSAANDRIIELQARLDTMLIQYTASHPEVVRLRSEIAMLRQQVREKQRAVKAFQVKRPAAETTAAISTQAGGLPLDDEKTQRLIRGDTAEKQQRSVMAQERTENKSTSDLERERDAYKSIYDDLARRLGRAEISAQMEGQDKSSSFRIIDPAVIPTRPVGLVRYRMLLLSMAAGICGAAAFILLLDQFDGTIKSATSIKVPGVTVIGIIPLITDESEQKTVQRRDGAWYAIAAVYYLGAAALTAWEAMRTWGQA